MIETNYFILGSSEYEEIRRDADELNVSVDYFLFEFCDVIGENVNPQ